MRVYHLAAALVPAAIFSRGPQKRTDWLWHLTALALLLTMTLRQRKLIGVEAWRYLDLGGVLHFALVAMAVWLLRDARTAPRAPIGT